MIVVFDSEICISAMEFGGTPLEAVIGAIAQDRLELEGTVTGICRDPKDEPILECAERAEAERIVTGDHDLLSLASYRGMRIMTARDYAEVR